jgi:hypothetical protein
VLLVGLVVAGLLAQSAVPAKSSGSAAAVAAPANSSIHLRFNLRRFQLDRAHRRLVAQGSVVAAFRSNGKTLATTSRPTKLTVLQQTSTCRVLHLELGELRLQLLGLIVSLTPVDAQSIVLDISANSDEALGKLFCQVLAAVQGATASTTAKTSHAVRRLSAVISARSRGGVFDLDLPLRSGQSQATTTGTTSTGTTTTTTTLAAGQCEVLDLVLGPLNLDLLGLVVQLNKVELNVSANPVGTLGTLFCQLAGSTTSVPSISTGTSSSTSTSSTTTAATTT